MPTEKCPTCEGLCGCGRRAGMPTEKIEPELPDIVRDAVAQIVFTMSGWGNPARPEVGDAVKEAHHQIAAALEEAKADQHHDDCRLCLSGNTTAAVLGLVPCYVEVNLRKRAAKLRKGE